MFGGVLSFHVNVVPVGKPSTLPMLFLASGTAPLSTVCTFGCGAYVSAWPLTLTLTGTSSLVPSG